MTRYVPCNVLTSYRTNSTYTQGPHLIEFNTDDANVAVYLSWFVELETTTRSVAGSATLIETNLYQELLRLCTTNDPGKSGVMIRGPPGTGKTLSSIYLLEKLKEESIPFLACSPKCFFTNVACCHGYIKSFFER